MARLLAALLLLVALVGCEHIFVRGNGGERGVDNWQVGIPL